MRESLAWHAFPEADPALLVEKTIEVPVQVSGKVRTVLSAPTGLDPDRLEAAARDRRSGTCRAGRPRGSAGGCRAGPVGQLRRLRRQSARRLSDRFPGGRRGRCRRRVLRVRGTGVASN